MREKGSRYEMEHRLYLTMTVLVTVILLCSLGFTLAMDIARERRALDRRITEAAAYVAELGAFATCSTRDIRTQR